MQEFQVAKQVDYNEQALLCRLAAGDETAFDKLFYYNWDQVYSAALLLMKSPQIANDIAQDTFLSLWKDRQKLDKIENLKGFLYTNVKFLVHKRLRRMRVEEAYTLYLTNKLSAVPTDTEQEAYVDLKQLQSSLQHGIELLPPQQQRAFRLSREDGLTHDQISQLMGVSKKTVKDYIVRSIAFLRPYLKRYSHLVLLLISLFE